MEDVSVSPAEQFKARFHAKYAELVAQGVAPNDAAALALHELQQLVPPPAPTARSSAENNAAVSALEQSSPSSVSSPVNLPPHSPAAPASPVTHEQQPQHQHDADDANHHASNGGDVDMDNNSVDEDEDDDSDDEAQQLALAMALSTATASPPRNPEQRQPANLASTERPHTPPAPPAPAPVTPIPDGPSLGEQLQLALEAAATSDDFRDVKRLVYQIFSDVATLNTAFVTRASLAHAVDATKWWGIDSHLLDDVSQRLSAVIASHDASSALQNTLRNALETLVTQPWHLCSTWSTSAALRFVLVLFAQPWVFDPDYVTIVGGVSKLVFHTPAAAKTLLREHWDAHFTNAELATLLTVLQQAITVLLYGAKKMDLVYACCSVLKELHAINALRTAASPTAAETDTTGPFAAYDAFYNDAVNSEVDVIDDYTRSLPFFRKRHALATHSRVDESYAPPSRMLSELSFCDFPFVLDAGSKSRILQVDSDLEQRTYAQDAVQSGEAAAMGAAAQYLILKVRRAHVIEDALQQLVQLSAATLKKPLKVKFIGEEGVDEGGVQKEFFQILIRELLDPAFGMFTYDSETHALWFNCDSLEATMEFELIGILLGLAIYNGVILDVHFPHTVYKKLLSVPLGLDDVERAMPALGRGLRQLLAFDGDVEEVFQRSFEYSYEVFGAVKTVELKPGGSAIPVTRANRDEYVALYVDYLLTASVARQYDAFHRGFHLVCHGDILEMFRWEELHLTICGSPDLDFEALEQVTHYDDGYTAESACIRHFWSVVHEFSLEDKKKLLMFSTGSDRVPIRGLATMTFVISRNGSDSDRLPSAHTWCVRVGCVTVSM